MTYYEHTFKANGDAFLHEATAREVYMRLHAKIGAADSGLRYGTDVWQGRQKGEFFPYSDDTQPITRRTDLLKVSFDSRKNPGVVKIDCASLTVEQIHQVITSTRA